MVKCIKCIHPWVLRNHTFVLVRKNVHHDKHVIESGYRGYSTADSPRKPGSRAIGQWGYHVPTPTRRDTKQTERSSITTRKPLPDISKSSVDGQHVYLLHRAVSTSDVPIHDIFSAYDSLASRKNLQLLPYRDLSDLISLFGSYAIANNSHDEMNIRNLPICLTDSVSSIPLSLCTQAWNALLMLISTKQQAQYTLRNDDLFWLSLHQLSRYEGGDALETRDVASLLNHIDQIDDHRISAWLLRRLAKLANPIGNHLSSNYLTDYLARHNYFSTPYIGLLAELVHAPVHRLSYGDRERILVATFQQIADQSNSSRSQAKSGKSPMFPDISELATAVLQAVFNRSRIEGPPVIKKWAISEANSYLTSSYDDLDQKWAYLRNILLSQAVFRETSSSAIPGLQDNKLSTSEIVSILYSWDILRQRNIRPFCAINDVRELWDRFRSICTTGEWWNLDKSILHCIFISFLHVVQALPDRELFHEILKTSSELGFFAPEVLRKDILHSAVQVGYVSVGFGARYWNQVFREINLAGIMIGEGVDDGSKKEIATRIVSLWAKRDSNVAYELYMATSTEQFRLTATTLSVLLRNCLKKGELEKAIACASDQSVSPKHRWHFVNFIVEYIGERDIQRLQPDTAVLLGETISQVIPHSRLQTDQRDSWEETFLLIQRSCITDVYLQGIRHVLDADPNFWSESFLSNITRALAREYPRPVMELGINHIRARDDASRIRRRIVEYLALRRHGHIAKEMWDSLDYYEIEEATLFQRILAAVKFQYREPKKPHVLHIPELLLSAPRILERDLNLVLYLLIRGGRNADARRVLRRVQVSGKLPNQVPSTKSLNILLNSALMPKDAFRGPRQIVKVTRYYRELFVQYDVAPDPVTMNLMLKCALRWQSISVEQVRALFNQCIISGYPGWTGPGLPFDVLSAPPIYGLAPISNASQQLERAQSDPSTMSTFAMATQKAKLSYERHVQPLYKMFSKAFRVRQDYEASQLVVQILKRARVKLNSGDRSIRPRNS